MPIKINDIPSSFISHFGEIIDIKFPRQGYTSNVGIVYSQNGNFVMKRTKGIQFCSWLAKEVEILGYLTKTNLYIPKVFDYYEDTTELQSWSLMEFIEGETIRSYLSRVHNQVKRNKVIFNFGKTLSMIHSTNCPSELKSESQWLDDMLIQAEYNVMNYEVDGSINLLNSLIENKPRQVKQTLIHGDFTIDNVLVKDEEITGVIDWSGGTFGDPRYDITLAIRPKPNIFEKESEVTIFFEGYGRKMLDEKEYDFFNGLYEFF